MTTKQPETNRPSRPPAQLNAPAHSGRRHLLLATLVVVTTAAAAATVVHAGPAKKATKAVAYPDAYRSWTHVKSMWLSKAHGLADPFAGMHHIYGNARSEKAMKAGKRFPDGSVIVFDLLAGEVKDEAIVEGDRAFLGVMEKNSAAYPNTGGWGFEVFGEGKRAKRAVKDGGVSCFQCHIGKKANDYVFSTWRK